MNNSNDWRDNDPDKQTAENWRKDPNNWIWNIFYYNKEDQRLFVSKKIEWMGTTLNFANPKSVLVLVAMGSFFGMVLYFILTKQ